MDLYLEELMVARQAAQKARSILISYFGRLTQVEVKKQAGLVSEADRAAEVAIKTHVKDAFPEMEFIGEEESFAAPLKAEINPKTPCWVVDPLDGTTNYIHGFPLFCVSIALVINRQPVVGVIDVPLLNNTYWASRGNGAYLNGQRLEVNRTNTLLHCLAATGFNSEIEGTLNRQLEIFNRIIPNVRGIRRSGSAAFDLAMVASGVFDFYWEQDLSPWDVAAGQIIVDEAGGTTTTFEGKSFNPWCRTLLSSNGLVHQDVVKIISNIEP